MLNFSFNTVAADGLAPAGARTSAGTVMTEIGFQVFNAGCPAVFEIQSKMF